MASDRHQLRVIKRAIEGDAEAFAGLCFRYADALYRYLYFRLGSVSAAEEVCAQVFVRAWETLPTDARQEVLPFTAWLFLVANDVVVERSERFAEAGLHPVSPPSPPKLAWPERGKRESNERSPLYPRFLAQAVMQLDADSQQVILLRFVLRLTHKETGLVIGDTSTGSRVLQYRALLELREKLTRQKMSEHAYASDHIGAVTFCLDRIISGRWTADHCLEHIAEEAAGIEPLLRFAVLVRSAVTVRSRKTFSKELRRQLVADIRKSKRKPVNRPQLWRWFQSASERIPAPVVAAFLLGLILFAGAAGARTVAFAVDSSAPGDRLYDLDLRLERAYRALVTNPETQFQVALSATEERLIEAERLAQRGDSEGLQIALVAYSVQVAELTNSDIVEAVEHSSVDLDQHFADQQQELDKIYTIALTTLASKESTEVAEVVCDAQTNDSGNWHPVGMSLAAQHGVDYAEIMKWVCDGHSFGEIVLALSTVDHGAVETVEVMELKSELGGWGQLWEQMGAGAALLRSEDEGTGLGIEVQRPATREIPPTRHAAPTPEITPSATATATPLSDEGNNQQDEVQPTSESGPPGGGPPDHAGPPDGVDPPGGGRPDDPGPPGNPGPPDDAGPPDNAGPPDDPGPPNDPGPPDDTGPPGGSPPGNSGNSGNNGNQDGGRP